MMPRRCARLYGPALAAAVGTWLPQAVAAPPAVLGPNGTPAASGFAAALEPRSFEFPQDHGPHPAFRQEWWYVTGNLDDASGERFGFELTFFRVALLPPASQPSAGEGVSAWRTREIYMAHFAVTDLARKRFRFEEKLSRAALGLAGARGMPLRVWLDDWSLEARPGGSDSAWQLRAGEPGYSIDIALEPQSGPVLNGEAGLSRKSDEPQDASYYYSIPHLLVHGRVLRDGQPLEVHGLAWLDREWGSGGLAPRQAGWDWFALQLDDGSALMFYALREAAGGRDAHSAGSWIAADGRVQPLSNSDVGITVTREWRNRSGDRYPGGWDIRVPSLALELSVRPVLADQELRTTPPYWEGAVDVGGQRAGKRLQGRGYVELVGYAQER
jgi:predicted secreted hydrolase